MKNLFGTLILTTLLALFCCSYAAAQMVEDVKLVASDGSNRDQFGRSVSIDGDQAIVGAVWEEAESFFRAGAAYIYERDVNGIWNETKVSASDADENDNFGRAVSIKGDRAIVGVSLNDDHGVSSGSAYIFERESNGNWNEIKLLASDATQGDAFGNSVSIDQDYAVVGAIGNGDKGSAYIFERDDNEAWNEIKLETNDDDALNFGRSVAIDGDRTMIGSSHAVYIFERQTNGDWNEVGQITVTDLDEQDFFADMISLDEGRAIVSFGTGNSGIIYERDGNDMWNEVARLSGGLTRRESATQKVSISGNHAVLGAERENTNGILSGSATLFKRDDNGNWNELTKLIPSDNKADDFFGASVSISGSRVLGGAYQYFHNFRTLPGAAYVFELDGVEPIFTTPYGGNELLDSSGTQTFRWSPLVQGVTEWRVQFGSEEEGVDYFDSGVLTPETLSVTVTDLPRDGSIIYASLRYRLSGDDEWYNAKDRFTAYTARPKFTDPLPGSILDQSTEVFTWEDNETDVSSYWLNAGSSEGASDYFNSGNMGLVNSVSVTGLPTDGSTVFIRLWYQDSSGSWRFVDETFLTGGINTSVPVLTYQLVDGRLTNPNGTETFTWSDNGANVTDYWLNVGSTFGASDYHRSGNIGQNTSATVTGLPTDRRSLVYVRLWYRISGGTWDFIDEEYKVFDPTLRPEITSPLDSKLTNESGTETFSWSANGIDITHYWMYVGSQLGYSDYYQSGALNLNTSTTVSGLPTDGTSPIFVRLWYRLRDTGRWDAIDIEYTAAD